MISVPAPFVESGKLEKTGCNRNKIISGDGSARFGPIYGVSKPEIFMEIDIPICIYDSNGTIMKSENGKKNKQKICVPTDKVYVIGEHNNKCDTDVLIFKEGGIVYKRKWNKIKDVLRYDREIKLTLPVAANGVFKNRKRCFRVEFSAQKYSSVWISEDWLTRQEYVVSGHTEDFALDYDHVPGIDYYPPQLF